MGLFGGVTTTSLREPYFHVPLPGCMLTSRLMVYLHFQSGGLQGTAALAGGVLSQATVLAVSIYQMAWFLHVSIYFFGMVSLLFSRSAIHAACSPDSPS